MNAWIIQDGNYGEFERDRSYRFALEFYSEDLRPSADGAAPSLRATVGAMHDAQGTVIRVTDSSWVVDFGVPAFQDSNPPDWARVGVGVSGMVYIGIDPFFYFESLKDEPGMPDLCREWTVRRILLETTPWITSTNSSGGRVSTRAGGAQTFKEVQKTDAWHDDGGHGHYVLECEPITTINAEIAERTNLVR
jgi:hypothetical protein